MARKRKRPSSNNKSVGNSKRQKTNVDTVATQKSKSLVIKQALLAQYYPQVFSLREFLLSKLPRNSKVRRKKIANIGCRPNDKEAEKKLSIFLDQTLIGVSKLSELSTAQVWQQWTTFSQKANDSISFANLSRVAVFSQSEIVDFAIWLLFSKTSTSQGRNQHLLCQGYRKEVTFRYVIQEENAGSTIPGVASIYPNIHVTSMKAWPWPQVLALMGGLGEKMMLELLLYTGVFLSVGSGQGTYHQLSGFPLNDLHTLHDQKFKNNVISTSGTIKHKEPRLPSSINFVRNRMMYARAALNRDGKVRFGLRHIHVLNRYPYKLGHKREGAQRDEAPAVHRNTIQVMMYIFPRQFGLHNPFTTDVDHRETVQPFNDYTLREDEIAKKFPDDSDLKIPKRLRGEAIHLIKRLQLRHKQCPYKELLEYYCPQASKFSIPWQEQSLPASATFKTQVSEAIRSTSTQIAAIVPSAPPQKISMMDQSTPNSLVSAFCRAVLARIIPHDFWGSGEAGRQNEHVFLHNVDHFIQLRRFETLSVHEVSQDIKISSIEWLRPPGSNEHMSQSDSKKRWEIFNEFMYYVFDSLLIPLLRANFHITESNVHRYKIFYFRHDVWRSLAEPALASLKLTMFEEVKIDKAQRILDKRTLGFSQVRLLPKESGIRPIMNLKRRALKRGSNNMLGPSINSVLAPVFNVLSYEKNLNPDRLGSTLFSVGDLYSKLKKFKSSLDLSKPLFFAKVDVQAAFDTIPQAAILKLISSLPSETEYRISKHAEIKPGDNHHADSTSKPIRRFTALAHSPDDFQTFEETLESELAIGRKNTIFIESIVNQHRETSEILNLLEEHIQQNMVKIGKKFYRQKEGIPQGSVLSSLLCNIFYADLEATHLSFLHTTTNFSSPPSLLLRLIDDFLLITTDPSHATRFLQTMHDGLPAYGVRVNPDKTLVNFECTINARKVPRLLGSAAAGVKFPYCGCFVDMKTLDISRDRQRHRGMAIVDSLTVEYSRVPGKTFQRKILNAFKIQAHAMFLDTSFNATKTVISNIRSAFVETALKMCAYIACLPVRKQPGSALIIRTFQALTTLAYVLIKSKAKNRSYLKVGGGGGYRCSLSKAQVGNLAVQAFVEVLAARQSRYREVLEWLRGRL